MDFRSRPAAKCNARFAASVRQKWINPTQIKDKANLTVKSDKKGPTPVHSFGSTERLAERIEIWLLDWLVDRAGVPREEINRDRPFAEYGLDSLTAVELSHDLEEWLGLELTPVLAWNYPTSARLSRHLAQQSAGEGASDATTRNAAGHDTVAEFERILAQVEAMSEDQVEKANRNK